MKKISIILPCYNEEANIEPLITRLQAALAEVPAYDHELLFIDNASTDRTVEAIKSFARHDRRIKLIVNARNFGQARSPYHAIFQASGDLIVTMTSDLQDPPEMIPQFVRHWEQGYRVVVGVKQDVHQPLQFLRNGYYRLLEIITDGRVIRGYHGFGVYDRQVIDVMRQMDLRVPYFPGLLYEIGFETLEIPYVYGQRRHGRTKNNLFTLIQVAMVGLISHSLTPLRMATLGGFVLSLISLLISFGYFILKLIYWDFFSLGTAPLLIGMFFFGSVQLFFIGILGEYIWVIHAQVTNRPLVVEKERVNFDPVPAPPPRPPAAHSGPQS